MGTGATQTAIGKCACVEKFRLLGSCDKALLFISLYHVEKKIVLKYDPCLVFQSACIYVRE
jgi:hypothetical protein